MGNFRDIRRLLEQLRASLRMVIEPRLNDIDSKLDHLIDVQRESRLIDGPDWRNREGAESEQTEGGEADVFSED